MDASVEMFPGSPPGPSRTFLEYFLPAFRGKYHVSCVTSGHCVSEMMILRGLEGKQGFDNDVMGGDIHWREPIGSTCSLAKESSSSVSLRGPPKKYVHDISCPRSAYDSFFFNI